jgi:hypothetical protein
MGFGRPDDHPTQERGSMIVSSLSGARFRSDASQRERSTLASMAWPFALFDRTSLGDSTFGDPAAMSCQVFREVSNCATFSDNTLIGKGLRVGGEGGIRTRQDALDTASCRLHNAAITTNASFAEPPCTPLHAWRCCALFAFG